MPDNIPMLPPADRKTPGYVQRLTYLESLEAPTDQRSRRLAARVWSGLWPVGLAIIIVLAVWQLIHLSGWKKAIFPGPGATLSNLWHQLQTGLLWQAIATTAQRAIIGFALAVLIGAVVGALVSRIRPLRAAVGSLITGLQTLPSIAWFPFAIILFGITTQAILFVIILGAAPSVANGLIAGVDYTPPPRRWRRRRCRTRRAVRRWCLSRASRGRRGEPRSARCARRRSGRRRRRSRCRLRGGGPRRRPAARRWRRRPPTACRCRPA